MELQWPLILFTAFMSASAGLFAMQGVYAVAGRGKKAQGRALAWSVAFLIAGGVAAFFHLTHPDRLFGGFGHVASGITQELIAIVVMIVIMVVFFALMRRERGVPKWCGILAVLSAVILVIIMGHSYMVESRPAWNSALQACTLLGAGFAIGTGAFAALDAAAEEDGALHGILNVASTVVNAVCTVAYIVAAAASTGSLSQIGFYFDPNHPTAGMTDVQMLSPFAGTSLLPTILAVCLAVAALILAIVGRKGRRWAGVGASIAICALIGAIALRVVFYNAGGSVFMFY